VTTSGLNPTRVISNPARVDISAGALWGSPLAAAAANASLGLLRGGDWRAGVARIEKGLQVGLEPARDLPGVRDVRALGAIGVVQLDHEVDVAAATAAAVREGVWLRPFRDLVYTMPPYVADDDDLARICMAAVAAAAAG
jgi:adenosylmethionine-8-amino-7-oxononanoate aminotransferase